MPMRGVSVPAGTGALGKCAVCLDRAITAGAVDLAAVPDAVVMVTMLQQFSAARQQIAAPSTICVCVECRRAQLAPVSKTGLVTA